MIKATDKNKTRYLILILFMPVLINGVNSFLMSFFGVSSTSLVTLLITGIAAIYGWILTLQGMKKGSVFFVIAVYALFALNFALFDYSREYLLGNNMILIYAFYLPISVLLIKDMTDWSDFIEYSRPFCYLTSAISVFVILFTNYSKDLNYMEFSYAVLPFAMLGYVLFRNKPKVASGVSFVAICLCILIFGARATILFTAAFVFYCEFFVYKGHVVRKSLFFLLAIMIVIAYIVFQDVIIQWVAEISDETGSRFLQKLTSGELFVSHGRDEIGIAVERELGNMGLKIYGLFADRYYCNIVYAHNIVYEAWLSFGWIIGTMIMLFFAIKWIRGWVLFCDDNRRLLFVIIFVGLFCRYFVSGSFVMEGRFYLCMAIMYALTCKPVSCAEEEQSPMPEDASIQ